MSIVSVGDIFKLGQIAFKLWELGFSKCRNPRTQYAQFGVEIEHLAGNLKRLGTVIKDATKHVPSSLSPDENSWDLRSLTKICGDFRKTIGECESLLGNHDKFARGRGGFVYNLQWNLTIEPEVGRLKARVVFHNIKIQTALQPLQIKLLQDLKDDIHHMHGDLASRTTELYQCLQEIKRLLEGHALTNTQDASAQPSTPIVPRVPDYLVVRFEVAAKSTNWELVDEKKFPFYSSINAFHHHFDDSTVLFKPKVTPLGDFFAERTPEPEQYLNLMKSIWIIQRIKKGSEWAKASSDRLSKCYMEQLEGQCLQEYTRFTTQTEPQERLKEPDQRNISLLAGTMFQIWFDGDEENESQSTADCLTEILHVSLMSSSRDTKQELVLHRKTDTKLQVRLVSSKTTGAIDREVEKDYINLDRAFFDPLYANPSSSTCLNAVFRGDESAGESTSLSFIKLLDLLAFQQAITSYKVVFDCRDIQTCLLNASGYFGRGKTVNEAGRLQIWNPNRLEKLPPQTQSPGVASPQQHRSEFSGSSSTLSVPDTIYTAHTSPVVDKDTMSYNFQLPGLPILVLYLSAGKNKNRKLPANVEDEMDDKMSYLTIQMDRKTIVSKVKCGCKGKRETCKHSTIIRPEPLLAQRITAKGNHSANLAMLGQYRAPKSPTFERNLRWLQIDFPSQDSRHKFEEKFEGEKQIYEGKRSRYYSEMNKVKQDHTDEGK